MAKNLDPSTINNSDDLDQNHGCLSMNCRDPVDQCMRHHFEILAKVSGAFKNIDFKIEYQHKHRKYHPPCVPK